MMSWMCPRLSPSVFSTGVPSTLSAAMSRVVSCLSVVSRIVSMIPPEFRFVHRTEAHCLRSAPPAPDYNDDTGRAANRLGSRLMPRLRFLVGIEELLQLL